MGIKTDKAVPESRHWYSLRLWVISIAFFVSGFAARIMLDREENVAFIYPIAVEVQAYWYLAGLACLFLWVVGQAQSWPMRIFGVATMMLMSLASLIAIISSVPK